MQRRRFEHLTVELSVALGRPVNRYALWLFLHERDEDPEQLSRRGAIAFCDAHLDAFLAQCGGVLPERDRRRLRRTVARFDPAVPTPDQTLARLGADRI